MQRSEREDVEGVRTIGVRLHCAECHAASPYECASEKRSRDFSDDEECYCPCHECPECIRCGSDAEWEDCWQCGGEGYDGHSCGEDCCACLHPEDNVPCDICERAGGWWMCSNATCGAAPAEREGGNDD